MSRSSGCRLFDASEDANRHNSEYDRKKRQFAERDKTEGECSEKQRFRSVTMRLQEPRACCDKKPGC